MGRRRRRPASAPVVAECKQPHRVEAGGGGRAPAAAAPAGQTRRVLVIGGGLSGAAAAWSLRRQQRAEQPPLSIHMWDGARGCGGRLATARIAVGKAEEARANMGAQRLHHHRTNDAPAPEAARLLCEAGVIEPEPASAAGDDQTASFVAAGSSNEVCKWLLRQAGAELRFGARIRSISKAAGGGWDVTAFGDKAPARFDAVVFGGSVAEVFTTHGDLTQLVSPHRKRLQAVEYSRACCAAIVLPGSGPAADAVRSFFGAHRSRPGVAGSELQELVLQPAAAGSDHLTVVAVSTERFGQSVKGLRATHRPSAQDLQVSAEVEQTLVRCACALVRKRVFLRHFILQMIVCQDRLGRSIGKTQKETRFRIDRRRGDRSSSASYRGSLLHGG